MCYSNPVCPILVSASAAVVPFSVNLWSTTELGPAGMEVRGLAVALQVPLRSRVAAQQDSLFWQVAPLRAAWGWVPDGLSSWKSYKNKYV